VEDNGKIDINKLSCDDVDWIQLSEDGVQWLNLLNMITDLKRQVKANQVLKEVCVLWS